MRALLLMATLVLQAPAPSAAPADDLAIYKAIVAHTIRPEADRLGAGYGVRTPAPILTFDRTLTTCRSGGEMRTPMGCIHDEEVDRVERVQPFMQHRAFEGRLTDAARQELVASFRQRNRESAPFRGTEADGFITMAPEKMNEVSQRESSRTHGVSRFSLPAYSADGHALVYASYSCGSLCGYGWLFLLERRGASWQVVDVDMIWIS